MNVELGVVSFYKHVAPLGLIGGRGSPARNWQWGTTIVVPYDSCCTHSLHERKNLTQGRYGTKVLIDLPLASLRLFTIGNISQQSRQFLP